MKTTPFTDVHIALGAKMHEFAGFNMPIEYSGIIDEELIAMMKTMEITANTEEQYAICRDVQKYIADMVIEIPLFSENTITFYSADRYEGWIEVEGSSIWNSYSIRYLHTK